MKDLKNLFEQLGFNGVTTYIQSGNVVFLSDEKDVSKLIILIEKEILKQYNIEVSVIIKKIEELIEVLEGNPFKAETGNSPDKIYFSLLSEFPSEENISKIEKLDYKPDIFKIIGKVVYVFCPDGYGRTKLNNNFFESKLKVKATTRNLKTLSEMINLSNSFSQ